MFINGATRVVGVIGWPVAHSLSPAIHNAAFAASGLDMAYVPLPVPPNALPTALAGLRGLGFVGANVTMPHKIEAAHVVARLSDDAETLDAVNTIIVDGDGLAGDNTDAGGFARFLKLDAGFDVARSATVVLGAGGAARAVALALAREGAGSITVAARDPRKAAPIIGMLGTLPVESRVVSLDAVQACRADLVVNATPIGTDGRSIPPIPALQAGMVVVDLLYHPQMTPLQEAAAAAGVAAFGGLGMLLRQAELSFERWTGGEAPFEVMVEAAQQSLAQGH
jgi:shikimate dehydrogenase